MDPQNILSEREWYKESIEKVLKHFGTNPRGLTEHRLEKNLLQYGKNELSLEKKGKMSDIFFSQFSSPLVYILVIASGAVLLLGDYIDSGVILFIVLLNAIIGAVQEGRAQNTLEVLKDAVKSYATVIRDGKQKLIQDTELVPGDIIVLKDSSVIPADARIIESNELVVNQSTLTGESEPVNKSNAALVGHDLAFADRSNMLYRGTYVISGLAKAVVVRTGLNTLIGKISKKLGQLDFDLPLKKSIAKLSNIILVIVATVSISIFIFGIYSGKEVLDMLLTVVAVSVAAIPESLPVVVTLVLATGVWRMSKKNVLVKKLQAVETLGRATIIAVDKTGTLTKNQMTVEKIYVNNRVLEVTGRGYNSIGKIIEKGKKLDATKDKDLDLIGKISAFTTIAKFDKSKEHNWKLDLGDPTEASLVVLAEKMGITKSEYEIDYPKIIEIPFSTKSKYHASINQINSSRLFTISGSSDAILPLCDTIWENGRKRKLTKIDRKKIDDMIIQFSSEGYRILALAANFNPPNNTGPENIPSSTFVGIVGIIDPIREEVKESVQSAQNANIKVVMITGDHVKTAEVIGRKTGILKQGDIVLTGQEMDQLDDEALQNKIDKVTIFARVSPENKFRIIQALQQKKNIVAMTGDGVNDALSLAAADLGVSMGENGTEVAREASDLILMDNNFGHIIDAAEEGRNIYWIIRRTVLYLLSSNLGELMVVIIAVFASIPLPLLASQIIWLNFVTDTFLAITLFADPKEKGLMTDVYRMSGKEMVDGLMLSRMFLIASMMTAVTLYMFSNYVGPDMVKAWTISLTTLTVFNWYNIFNIRSHVKSVFSKSLFSNKFLLLGLVIAISMHMLAIYNPFMQSILHTTGLSLKEWGIILVAGLSIIAVEEIRKLFYRMQLKVRLS